MGRYQIFAIDTISIHYFASQTSIETDILNSLLVSSQLKSIDTLHDVLRCRTASCGKSHVREYAYSDKTLWCQVIINYVALYLMTL